MRFDQSESLGVSILLPSATYAAATVEKIGYIGRKPYIRLLADFSGTHGTGTPMSALAVTGNLLSIAP